MDKPDRSRLPDFELAAFPQYLGDGSGTADQDATAAGMAQLRVNQHLLAYADDGAVLADLAAQAAVRALLFIHRRMQPPDRAARGDLRFEKKMPIRFFHVAIQVSDAVPIARRDPGEIGCNRGLSRSRLCRWRWQFSWCVDSSGICVSWELGRRAADHAQRRPNSVGGRYSGLVLPSSPSMRLSMLSSARSKRSARLFRRPAKFLRLACPGEPGGLRRRRCPKRPPRRCQPVRPVAWNQFLRPRPPPPRPKEPKPPPWFIDPGTAKPEQNPAPRPVLGPCPNGPVLSPNGILNSPFEILAAAVNVGLPPTAAPAASRGRRIRRASHPRPSNPCRALPKPESPEHCAASAFCRPWLPRARSGTVSPGA